jgi:hypothetical protein
VFGRCQQPSNFFGNQIRRQLAGIAGRMSLRAPVGLGQIVMLVLREHVAKEVVEQHARGFRLPSDDVVPKRRIHFVLR